MPPAPLGQVRETRMSPANRRYALRAAFALAAYVILTIGLSRLFHDDPPTGWLRWVLAAAPALPVLGLFGAAGLYLVEETDEFARMVVTRSMLIAGGLTMAFASVWDSLATYGQVEPLRPFLQVTLFFVLWGLAQPIVRLSYR